MSERGVPARLPERRSVKTDLRALGLAVIGLWIVIGVASVALWATSAPRRPLSSVFGGGNSPPAVSAAPSAGSAR